MDTNNFEEGVTGHSWCLPHLYVKNTKDGKGLFSGAHIVKGEVVILFGGYVMTLEQERHLESEMQDYAHQIDEHLVLGVRSKAELQKVDFLNHSCNPSCGFKSEIRLVAMRDIFPGDEIIPSPTNPSEYRHTLI